MLAFLSNLVEFFEKLVRAKHAATLSIVHFVVLNFLPSIFDYMPVASWLVTCLVIRELYQQNEWEVLQILSIGYNRLHLLFLSIGIILSIASFIGKEYIAAPLALKSEHFKAQTFKKTAVKKIINKWLMLDQHTFFHAGLIDVEKNEGTDLLIMFMTPDFIVEKTIIAETFSLDSLQKKIIIPQGKIYSIADGQFNKIQNENFFLPSLFSQMQLNLEAPSFTNLGKHLIFDRSFLPPNLHRELLYQFLKRLAGHFQLIFYPLLTFCLFALFSFHAILKWVLILIPYPSMIFITACTDSLARSGVSAWIALLPLLVMMVIIVICRRKSP